MSQPVEYATPGAARFYTPDARFDRVRLGVALPAALLLAVLIGWAYSFVEIRLSSIHFHVLSAVAAAAALGLLTAGLLNFCRVHHRALALLLGTSVGLVGLWASWVAWVHYFFIRAFELDVPLVRIALHPARMFSAMRAINDMGAWLYQGQTYRGAPLLGVWVIEALILVLGCTFVASHAAKSDLYCPACRKRCKRPPGGLGRFDGAYVAEVRPHLEAGDFDYLLELGPVPDDDAPEVRLELLTCPCGQTNVLNAVRAAWEDNGQGGSVVKVRPLVTGLLLSAEQVAAVRSLKERLPGPSDAAATSAGDGDDDADSPAETDDEDGGKDEGTDPYDMPDRRP
jgi:hypothetical protein